MTLPRETAIIRLHATIAEEVSTLSRAFTKELDGWNFCRSRKRECSDAAFNGRCERDSCKYKEDDPIAPAAPETEKNAEKRK